MKKALFTLDGEKVYEGWFKPEQVLWNGFYIPFFEEITAGQILEDNEFEWAFDQQYGVFTWEKGSLQGGTTAIKLKEIGDWIRPIGAFEWTWQVVVE